MRSSEQCAEDISRIFDSSATAAAVVRRDGEILYKNAACEKLLDGGDCELYSVYNGTSYEKTVLWGMKSLRLCVTPLEGECCLVSIVPERGNYTYLLSGAVRKAAGSVSGFLEELSEICADGRSRQLLDSLDGAMLTLLSEALIPEELEILNATAPCDHEIICVSEAVRRFVDELGRASASSLLFIPEGRKKIASGLYARIPESALRLLLLDFISVCMDGEYCVEGIGIQLSRDAFSESAVLELTCGFIGHKENASLGRGLGKPEGAALPVSGLEETLKSGFGCEISRRGNSDFSAIRVKIPLAEPKGIDLVRAPVKLYGSFCAGFDIRAYLARHGINGRYLRKDKRK